VLKTKVLIVAASSPIVSGIAGRYATALFELASEGKALDKVDAALDGFLSLLDGSEDLQRLIANPVFTADEQVSAINALLKKAKIDGIAGNFLSLVASKRRLFLVRPMIAAFKALLADKNGVVAAEVTVAAPLSAQHREAVLAALEGQAGGKIALTEKVDPSIIGGLVVKMGSKMIDASLKTKLNAMKLAMIAG
jgi:F-type H+-transporting ATPase subunit delta